MSALKKEDVFNEIDALEQFIKSLSADEREAFSERLKSIKKKVEKLLSEEDEHLYNGMVNKSLQEVWVNEKDDAYNDL